MKPITRQFDHNSSKSLYIQLYEYLKDEIHSGGLSAGERLPSLRALSGETGLSVTTVQSAYDQLLIEGYVTCRPQSGYFAADIGAAAQTPPPAPAGESAIPRELIAPPKYRTDRSSFEFAKWKKCMSRVLTDYPDLLLTLGDRQGEPVLRSEISRYLLQSRGVRCTPGQVVVSAGTQQLTSYLARILRIRGIDMLCSEEPGYLPVQNVFRDNGFVVNRIPMRTDGITIEKLPENLATAVYVTPSNQYPTGSVMPVARRYQLLEWARKNGSVIIEDDYDSELRYFGKPVPALQGLDDADTVVYLGSFTSTLFPAIRISYMILPLPLTGAFRKIRENYDQTCSKTEQLTLALFMQNGSYRIHIKKLRAMCARKLRRSVDALNRYGQGFVEPINTSSGLNILLRVRTSRTARDLQERAEALRLRVTPADQGTTSAAAQAGRQKKAGTPKGTGSVELLFYYNQIPMDEIEPAVRELIASWRGA